MPLRDRSPLGLAAVAALVILVIVVASPPPTQQATERRTRGVDLVRPVENGTTKLWPYTSRGRTFDRATLPINVVVDADATTTTRLLTSGEQSGTGPYWDRKDSTWQSGSTERANATLNGTGIRWGASHGAARYTYLLSSDRGVWRKSTYQVSDGPYFGSRYHLRLYEGGPEGERWTAIQGHHEYWDWFRLRHNVDSVSRAQHYLERDFMGTGLLSDLRRDRWGNGGAIDADGWVTVVDLRERVTLGPNFDLAPPTAAGGSLLVGSAAWLAVAGLLRRLRGDAGAPGSAGSRRRLGWDHLTLYAATAALPLVVRVGAIAAERAFLGASPVLVGAPFYLLLVAGLPAVAVAVGRRLPAGDAFATAVLGFGTGIMADYAFLQLAAVPYSAIVQRLVLLLGLGLLAAGGTRWSADPAVRHGYRALGLVVWVGAVVWPQLGIA